MQGPEGRPLNVSPARKGWEIDPEEDASTVGAALTRFVPSPFVIPSSRLAEASRERNDKACALCNIEG
jgi:hypothetical protein